jgi:hypothetical protein
VPTRYDTWLPEATFTQPEMHTDGHCGICLRSGGPHERSAAVVEPLRGAIVVRTARGERRLHGLDEHLTLSRGVIIEVGSDDVEGAVSRMVIDATGGSEDVLDWADAPPAWVAMDADLEHRLEGLDFVHRWVAVGRVRVTGVRLGDLVRPIAVDLRGPGLLMPTVLARFGGAQMGLAHGWRLSQVQMVHGGSARADARVGSDTGAVAMWLHASGLGHLAAMFIEPLDPDGHLTMLERQRCYDRLIGVLGDARLGVPADELRSRLIDSAGYQRGCAAMADPRSDEAFWESMESHARTVGTREVFRPERT